nr:MAG TPA: Regulatory protein [Caudoviricetes sp.]
MMNEYYASGLTNEQLKAEILRQGRKANLRLIQLRKSGYYKKNPIVMAKWDTFLHESKYATKNNYFKTGSKDENRADLLKQYVQIRQFLGQQTSVVDTKRIMRKHAKRLNIEVDTVERVLEFYGDNAVLGHMSNSDEAQKFVRDMVTKGFNDDEINAVIDTLEKSAKTESDMNDLMRNFLQTLE